ncbi:MAG: MoaD/ThiS family protein [Promethearchaeota archaeon]
MAILVKLYGDLREKVKLQDNVPGIPNTITLEPSRIKVVYDVIKQLNISIDDISHIFVNSNYSGPGKKVTDGDRVGLFPTRMAIMFAEIPKMKSIYVNLHLISKSENFVPVKATIDIPDGSTIKSILLECKNFMRENDEKILVNGKLVYDKYQPINNGDYIEIIAK